MKNEKWSISILTLLLLATILIAVPATGDEENLGSIKEECGDDETAVMGLTQIESEYGSHVFEHEGMDYKVCFEEKEKYIDDDFEFKYDIGKSCGDGYTPVMDVHDPDETDKEGWGSHAGLNDSRDDGRLCLKHTGYKEIVNVTTDKDDCEEDYCYHLVSLADDSNSHVGERGWGEYDIWMDVSGLPEYDLNITIDPEDCPDDDCEVDVDPGPEIDEAVDLDPCDAHHKCYRYEKYDAGGNIMEVDLDANAPGEDWIFHKWEGNFPGEETEEEKINDLEMTDDRELTAYFLEYNKIEVNVTLDIGGAVVVNGVHREEEYYEGEHTYPITLEADPNEGWSFYRWGGDIDEDDDRRYERKIELETNEDKYIELEFREEGLCEIEICGPGGVCDTVTVRCPS